MNNDISLEYGGALFMLAKEENKIEEYHSHLMAVKQVFTENPSYVELLRSPNLAREEKSGLVEEAFGGKVKDEILSFLLLITENGRIGDIDNFIESFVTLYDAFNRHIVAKVKTVAPLTEKEQKRLIEKLSLKSGCSVSLDIEIDKSLIGGMVVYMDGTVIDGSIKSQLVEMKRVLTDESKT